MSEKLDTQTRLKLLEIAAQLTAAMYNPASGEKLNDVVLKKNYDTVAKVFSAINKVDDDLSLEP
jgi:hypothetical protein